MIIMDLKMDNFCAFHDFHMNMSYPKKVVNSYIESEHLLGHPNFRYKKVNILMGTNASGKTSIGKMLMSIFNFIDKKEYNFITSKVNEPDRAASFSLDFVPDRTSELYRVCAQIMPPEDGTYKAEDIALQVKHTRIGTADRYETCAERLEAISDREEGYLEQLEDVPRFSWLFTYPVDTFSENIQRRSMDSEMYANVLKNILMALDTSIVDVKKSTEVKDSYIIRYAKKDLFMQEGKLPEGNILSSGTQYGIDIAWIVANIVEKRSNFFYCDEKFSYIHSDIEKAVLSLMINKLGRDMQLFFTSHNTDILDLCLPKHSFTFLKKTCVNNETAIECVYASDFLKRNTDSLRNAVDNDLFSIAPELEKIYEIEEM